jgi:hypothetical protein
MSSAPPGSAAPGPSRRVLRASRVMAMAKPVDALDFLAHPAKHSPGGLCVLFGDEPFLKRQVLGEIKQHVLSGDDAEFSVSQFTGEDATFRMRWPRERCLAADATWLSSTKPMNLSAGIGRTSSNTPPGRARTHFSSSTSNCGPPRPGCTKRWPSRA